MKKILSIARVVLLLLLRNGTALGMIFITSTLAVFIFFATNSNCSIADELHLRLKYSLIAMTTLVNVSVLYLSVFSLRKDIDERRFHTIAAAPVYRLQIWFGKFLGIFITGAITFTIATLAIWCSIYIFISNWEQKRDIKSLDKHFYASYMQCEPDLTELNSEISIEYKKRLKKLIQAQNQEEISEDDEKEGMRWRKRKYMLYEVRREKQMIPPGEKFQWDFTWNSKNAYNDDAFISFKSYSNQREKKFKGIWSIVDMDGKILWSKEFSDYPYLDYKVNLPINVLPKSGNFKLEFKNIGKSYVVFPIFNHGLKILYHDSNIFQNYILYMIFSFLGIAITTALALTCASIFSFPVAVFVAMIFYFVENMSGLLKNILNDLSYHDSSFIIIFYKSIITFVLWLTQMIQIPPVNSMFANSISIPAKRLILTWGVTYLIYFLIIVIIGTFILKNKELDKILSK